MQNLMDPSRNMGKYRHLLAQTSGQTPMIPFYPVVRKVRERYHSTRHHIYNSWSHAFDILGSDLHKFGKLDLPGKFSKF